MRAPPGRVALSIATGLLLALGGTQSAGAFSVDPDAAPADAELAADVEEIGATGASAPVDAAEPAFPAVDAAPAAGEPDPLFDDVFDEMEELGVSDPLESTNRAILRFNRGVDSILLDPLTRFYRFVLPAPARRGIRNVFLNLDSPSILV
ncbi:MAG: MlaA family lipoprotein, partial [Myxococcota bacterium]